MESVTQNLRSAHSIYSSDKSHVETTTLLSLQMEATFTPWDLMRRGN